MYDIWYTDVINWEHFFEHNGFKVLEMIQQVKMTNGFTYKTTSYPIGFNGKIINIEKGAQ